MRFGLAFPVLTLVAWQLGWQLAIGDAAAQFFTAPKQPARPAPPVVTPVPRPQPPPSAGTTPPSASEAQSAPAPASPPAPTAKPPGGAWIARCISESRQSPVECSMEETVVLSNGAPNGQVLSGQVYASLLVRVPTDTRAPVLLIQVPNGFFLPAGLNLQIDDGKVQLVPLQTCDQKGCYASTPVTADLLAALKSGKRLTITLQNMAKANVIVPVGLDNFAEAYQRIQ